MFSWAGATYHRCKSFIFSVLGRIGDLAAVFSIRSGAGAGLDSKNSIFEIGPFPPNTLVNIELASIFGPFFLGSFFLKRSAGARCPGTPQSGFGRRTRASDSVAFASICSGAKPGFAP